MKNHLENSVIEHIYETLILPQQEEVMENFKKERLDSLRPIRWSYIFPINPEVLFPFEAINKEPFEMKLDEYKPDPIVEMLLSLSRETDDATRKALKLVTGHLEILNQEGGNLFAQIPTFLNDIDRFCKENNLSDVNSVKKAHRLQSDAFDVYYNILKGIFQKMKEKISGLDMSVKISELLDEASRFIFREECTLLPFLVEKLNNYKEKLQRSLAKLKETINDPDACKRAINKTFQEYFESNVDVVRRELRVVMEEFKFAADKIQQVHLRFFHEFSSTSVGKEYFRTLDDDGQPGDELAVSMVKHCFESNADSTSNRYNLDAVFQYTLCQRLLEHYQVNHTFQGVQYQPFFVVSDSQKEAVQEQVTAEFQEAMLGLCGNDSHSLEMLSDVVSCILVGTRKTSTQSKSFWQSVFNPGKCHIFNMVQGIQINIRPLLVLGGYLTSDSVQILSCHQAAVRDKLSQYETFQCNRSDNPKYYDAITQGHKGKCIPLEVEQVMIRIFKEQRRA